MMNVMQSVIKMVNRIRGRNKAKRHETFVSFLKEVGAEFSYLPLYTSIRRLSAGKVLEHFFGLCKEVFFIFSTTNDSTNTFQAQLRSIEFLCSLAILTDMKNHLSIILNFILQGKGQSISYFVRYVEGFCSKLVLVADCLPNNNFVISIAAQSLRKNSPMLILHS